ncbi:membrane protein [Pontibacillus halophilus JSM 076056 = DSM 19796]|uniref:Membrane protein n=1 Tax=Pontibacillus halophilus JSM 076056 = DSM 19796 TaxID=1385510 RepID=A0A0A5GC34_9BACI|nr:membrane protein [Pontibacillus halophilus JSM 076056 = DSM 19796]
MDIQREKEFNYVPWVIGLSIAINLIVTILFFMPEINSDTSFDLTILPLLNAIFNSFTTVFLFAALFMILRKNVKWHKRFIFAAFSTTALFLVTYLSYHAMAPSTSYGGEGILQYIYYFILITHIILAIVIVPLALISLFRGLAMKVDKHRKIARWTMPLWLYVSITGVLVYIMISPYY